MMLAASASTGWFLENAFLIPLIPAIGFAIIIGFGRRLPKGGSEVGIASMALSLTIAIGTTVQWIQRVGSVDEGSGEHALGGVFGFARSVFPAASEGGKGEAYVEPVTMATETTVVLVAHDGEWTRRRVESPAEAKDLAAKWGIPIYDAAVVGYPPRMREWTRVNKDTRGTL